MRDVLLRQLELVWSFATQFVLDGVHEDLALWEPSGNVVTVHNTDDEWVADWPDEEHPPLPDATIGWLLWHIEFWWTNAADATEGQPTRAPDQVRWSGSTAGVLAAHDRWVGLLNTHDLDALVTGLMPDPRPFAFLAAWVNFELTKNLAEINQLKIQHANRQR
jgi:hypothetical protein